MLRCRIGLVLLLSCAVMCAAPAEAVQKHELRHASLLATALQLAPAPAPGPAPASNLVSESPAAQPESIPAAGTIDPVSAPVLTALVPIAGEIRATLNTSIQQVSSAVPSIVSAARQTGDDVAAAFTGRKLLQAIGQDAAGKPLRLANKPQLKRLQGKSVAGDQQQAQPVVTGNAQDDALIEKDLAQMKADRLKRIQALPSTVWS